MRSNPDPDPEFTLMTESSRKFTLSVLKVFWNELRYEYDKKESRMKSVLKFCIIKE